MLKHPDLTLRRIKMFTGEVKGRVYGARASLSVEVNEHPATDDGEALNGTWKPAEPGYRWGPAYTTRWFRLRGSVPKSLDGLTLRAVADVGGERTVWKDGCPTLGVDVEHTDFGILGGGAVLLSDKPSRSGEEVEILIQATARNPQARVHGVEPPRDLLTETYERAELVAFDHQMQALAFDLDFGIGLLEALDPNSPERAQLLRALNDVVNAGQSVSTSDLRSRIAEALGSLGGGVGHSITPMGHAHLDTAWLWPISVTKLKMAHTTATQLAMMERYPWYGYVHSQASQYEWLEKECPALFEKVKAAIKQGQWEPVGSMWVEADCNLPSGESLVRQFLYGRKYFREKLGVETDDMFLPDVFGYSAALPQILAGFGINYFLTQKISWNQFNRFPHNTFWWQGIDGTRVWSHFPPADTYVGNCEPGELLRSVQRHQDHARSDESLYLFGFGDGGGGPTIRHLELLERASKCSLLPKIELGKRAKDFYSDCCTNSRDLATWTGELYLELHRGTYTSQAANKRANRECEFLLRDAEMLAAFAFPGDEYPADELERAWKLVLLNQFHDIIPGSSVREVYEDSAKDYEIVRGIGTKIVTDSLERLSDEVDPKTFMVYQSASVPQTTGRLPWSDEPAPGGVDGCEGAMPCQIVSEYGERSLIFPVFYPICGYGPESFQFVQKALDLEHLHVNADRRSLSRKYDGLQVQFDETGCITSLKTEALGEFIPHGSRANMFQLLEDKPLFWSAWDVDPFAFETAQDLLKLVRFEVIENGPVRAAVEVERAFGASRIIQRISVGPSPGVRFDTWVDWRETDKMLKVAFPLAINSPRATHEIQFGHVERPTHSNTSWDMARFETCAQKWVSLSEGNRGIALLNYGKYGHDVQGNTLRLSLLRSPKAPDSICDMGEHRFSYALLPHAPNAYDYITNEAIAFNAPIWSVRGRSPKSLGELCGVNPNALVIDSVKRAEDGRGIIVRLYECMNSRGTGRLTLPFEPNQGWRCNLEERDLEPLMASSAGGVLFEFRPFEIITLRLIQ